MSEIRFSNLIFEEKKVLAQDFRVNKPVFNSPPFTFQTKPNINIDVPLPDLTGTKLPSIKRDKAYILTRINDPRATYDELKKEILTSDMNELEKTDSIRLLDEKKNLKLFKNNLNLNAKSGTGTTLMIDPESGTPLSAEELARLQLESHYTGGIEQDPSVLIRGMQPSVESTRMEQEQNLASLEAQYNETKKKINLLDKVYAELVRNPTNLNLGNILNAHSNSKFIKLAEKDIKEADEVTEEYYDDLLPGFGTALEHPEKYRNIPTDEIKPHKAPKFIKVK
jgi:hypothetical protein